MADDVLTFEELRRVQSGERESDTLQDIDDGFLQRARKYLELKDDVENHLQNQEYRNAKNILEDILDMRQRKIVKLAFLSAKSGVNVENLLPSENELFEEVERTVERHRGKIHGEVFDPEEYSRGSQPSEQPASAEQESEDSQPVGKEGSSSGGEESAGQDEESAVAVEEDDDGDAAAEGVDDDDGDGGEPVDDVIQFDGSKAGDEETAVESGAEEEDTGDADDASGDGGGTGVTVRTLERVPEFMGTDLEPYGPFEAGEEAEIPAENAEVLEEQGKAERI